METETKDIRKELVAMLGPETENLAEEPREFRDRRGRRKAPKSGLFHREFIKPESLEDQAKLHAAAMGMARVLANVGKKLRRNDSLVEDIALGVLHAVATSKDEIGTARTAAAKAMLEYRGKIGPGKTQLHGHLHQLSPETLKLLKGGFPALPSSVSEAKILSSGD